MQITSVVFSPTGGTQIIASLLAEVLRQSCGMAEASFIDLTDPAPELSPPFQADDLAVIVVPSFGGRAPAVSMERLRRVDGNGAKAVLVCVYGSRAYEDTLVEMQDAAEDTGFCVIAAIAAVCRHSMLPTLASERPNAHDEETLTRFAQEIVRKWCAGEPFTTPELPGSRPYKSWNGAIVPHATERCTRCGICAENCPAQAIKTADPTVVDSDSCAFCMRCVHFCPANARQIEPSTIAALTERLQPMCDSKRENELFV